MKEQVDDRLAMFRIASVHSTAYRGKTRVIKNRINYLWIYWWSIIINYWILLLLMWYFLNVIKIRFPIFLTLARKIKIPTLKVATPNKFEFISIWDSLFSVCPIQILMKRTLMKNLSVIKLNVVVCYKMPFLCYCECYWITYCELFMPNLTRGYKQDLWKMNDVIDDVMFSLILWSLIQND